MNQSSFDYAVLTDSIGAELDSLRAEKQMLEENIREAEARLDEISLREEKLARFSESLSDLLSVYPARAVAQNSLSPERENETPFVDEAETATACANEVDQSAKLQPIPFSDQEMTDSPGAADPGVITQPGVLERDFNSADFFRAYPHLRGARQPIHILAEKLLEYLAKPTKLRDLTRYILELGYNHHSQNFTNTVHTVLKNKRDRGGSFYFDPIERMWELNHWRRKEAGESYPETPGSSTAPKSEMPQPDENFKSSTGQKRARRGSKINSISQQNKTNSNVKIIKAASRRGV